MSLWLYQGKSVKELPKDCEAFVYLITNTTNANRENLISELKLKEYKFKIIRHRKKDALLQRIFKNFKKN